MTWANIFLYQKMNVLYRQQTKWWIKASKQSKWWHKQLFFLSSKCLRQCYSFTRVHKHTHYVMCKHRITFSIFLLMPIKAPSCSCVFFPFTSDVLGQAPIFFWPITFHHLGYPFRHKWPSTFNKTREASGASMVKRSLPLHFPHLSAVLMESHVWKLYFPCGHSSILWVICSA